jgi:hypothetical protein
MLALRPGASPDECIRLACALRLWGAPSGSAVLTLGGGVRPGDAVPPLNLANLPWYYSRLGDVAFTLLDAL